MIRVAASNSLVDAAWAAFDAAAIDLHRTYARADPLLDGTSDRAARMKKSQDVLRLWDEWRALFLGDQPGPAA